MFSDTWNLENKQKRLASSNDSLVQVPLEYTTRIITFQEFRPESIIE